MLVKEIVYMINDELHLGSDDSQFTLDHILFLCNKYRSFLLHQRYTDIRKPIAESNYSTLCIDLIKVPAIDGEPCNGGFYLRSKNKIPFILKGMLPKVYPIDFYQGTYINLISKERMRYVGFNKWMQNIIYCSIGPDHYLYFKSSNPQHMYLEKVKLTAIFEDIDSVLKQSCWEDNKECDIMELTYPIEENLVPQLIQLVVNELKVPEFTLPNDNINNAKDDLNGTVRKS